MEHVSKVLETCGECNGNAILDGPVPDDNDRDKWWSDNGDQIECPMCDRGLVEWQEDWHAGGSAEFSLQWGECEDCDGSGRVHVDRCSDCFRIMDQYGKGPEKMSEADRVYDRLDR
jgi:hypothetical protein